MAWVYAPEGHSWINTNYIQQIVVNSLYNGKIMAYIDNDWVEINSVWYEKPPEMKEGK